MYSTSILSPIVPKHQALALTSMSGGNWWMTLDNDYHKSPLDFYMDPIDHLRVLLSSACDTTIRTIVATVLGAIIAPIDCNPIALRKTLRDKDFYLAKAMSRNPKEFFYDPPDNVAIRTSRPYPPYFKPKDGVCEHLSFRSPFIPVNPRLNNEYLSYKYNQYAHARYWRHNDGPRPTICAIHGFVADYYWLNEWFFALPWFYNQGCDVLLYTMPFHGPRQSPYSLFSGHGFFSGGISRANEAFAQTVYDFRIFYNYLKQTIHAPKVGVMGISLGGYTTAILSTIENDLSFAIPGVPVASIADLLMEWFPLNKILQFVLKMRGRTIQDVRELLAVHCPLTYQPIVPKERRMIFGGAGDRFATPRHANLLWDHWDHCKIHWFPGSHLLHLDRGNYLRQIKTFLRGIDFLDSIPMYKIA